MLFLYLWNKKHVTVVEHSEEHTNLALSAE